MYNLVSIRLLAARCQVTWASASADTQKVPTKGDKFLSPVDVPLSHASKTLPTLAGFETAILSLTLSLRYLHIQR